MLNPLRLIKSFSYALAGIAKVFREEQNFRVHALVTLAVALLAVFLQIQLWQAIILIMVIALVLILEIINSIIERFVDLLKPRIHHYVQDIKDMSAALVFIGALSALIIGILIFAPYFLK